MGLKEAIVIVNEYSIKKSGKGAKGGSRGGTPGNYILRYMAREDATEIATPVTLNNENYILRYMARKDAVESLDSEEEIQRSMKRNQRLGGIAFGNDNLSMSHKELVQVSKSIQDAFLEGKTVMKTVISFEEEYLRDNNIIADDFEFKRKGDYRGNIDQMKLRHAISNGIEYMSRDYDDLKYVGIIQVDTAHVHCHLAMVDMGEGNITEEGTQKGKISAATKAKLRRGIDLALDDTKEIQYMASNVGIDKRNLQTNIKKYTYNQILLYGAPQRIMAELPEDETMWRAKSNRKEMKKANQICRDYVENILNKPDSGFEDAMQAVCNYVEARKRREDLEKEEEEKLIKNGRNNIIEGSMNGVYSTLKQIPYERRNVSTSFLNMVSAPMIVPSFKGDAQDMVYRMSAYNTRYDKHKTEAKKYADYISDYEKAYITGDTVPESNALYQFFLVEKEYQSKLASKYSQFLFCEEPSDDLANEYMELAKKAKTLEGMKKLAADSSAKKMKPENAELYGRERYDVYGGKYVISDPLKFNKRIEKYEKMYNVDNDAFQTKLQSSNFTLQMKDGNVYFAKKNAYEFSEVKGLDLHDLRGDFNKPLRFGEAVRTAYIDMAIRRIDAYDKACEYLDNTGQEELKRVFDNRDIEAMRKTLYSLQNHAEIKPVEHPVVEYNDKKVIYIDKKMHEYIKDVVEENVSVLSVEYNKEYE